MYPIRFAAIAAVFALAANSPAEAISVSFTPAGNQIDDDPINDYLLEDGSQIIFDVFADFGEVSTNDFSYSLVVDSDELRFISSDNNVASDTFDLISNDPNQNGQFFQDTFTFSVKNEPVSGSFLVATATFEGVMPVSDGTSDFTVGSFIINGEDQDGSQGLDVQDVSSVPEPSSILASFLLILTMSTKTLLGKSNR